jgi:hypothetical protein
METGVLGVPCQLVLLLAEGALNLTVESATTRQRLTGELLAQDHFLKLLGAMSSHAELVN